MAGVARLGPDARSSGFRIELPTLLLLLAIGAVALVIGVPILLLAINSFQVGALGQETVWGLDNWRAAFAERQMREAILNTITLTLASQAIAFFISVAAAFLIARTNLPAKGWLEFGFWIAVFLPSLTVTLGWIVLLDGHRGLINTFLTRWFPFLPSPPFDVFSWWGIVFLHVVTVSTAIKIVLLAPAFRNMDSALEEAARSLGCSPAMTLIKIVVPAMAPVVLVILVLGTIRSIQSFEIELILGAPRQIEVYSTLIYRQVFQEPPLYGKATVLSLLTLALLVPMIFAQQWLTHRRSHATVSGKFSSRLLDLGRWRWPAFAAVAVLCLIMTVLPVAMVVMGTFMKLFGFFTIADPWTLKHWETVLGDVQFSAALFNTIGIGAGTVAIALLVFPALAYIAVRARSRARGVLDFLTWLPSALPGIVIGLGFLWLFLGAPMFKSLYGTHWVLIAVLAIGSMTLGVQIIKSHMLQFGAELEEAARAHGGSWLYAFRRVMLPLSTPALVAVAVYVFGSAAREVSLIALLSTRAIEPLSIYQLLFVTNGKLEHAAVVGVIITALSVGVTIIGRIIGGTAASPHDTQK